MKNAPYFILAVALLGLYAWLSAQSDDDAPLHYSHVKPSEESFSTDLSGNMRVTLETLLSGEDETNDAKVVPFVQGMTLGPGQKAVVTVPLTGHIVEY